MSDQRQSDESTDAAHEFSIEESLAGTRLDTFLAQMFPEISRMRVRRGIDNGLAIVDGRIRKPSYKLRIGEKVKFQLPDPPATGPEPEPIAIDLLFEDDHLAVINKPAGMVVHPAKGHWSGTLASALVHHFKQLSQYGGPSRPGIVHRLDRDTSGVMVVAKTDIAHANLASQFQVRTVKKEYLAVVCGTLDRDRDLIDFPIGDHPSQRERKALLANHSSSREAQTFYEVEQRFKGLALVRAFPKTGRTHQIRLHMTHVRCPILCDKLYGGRSRLTAGELRKLCREKLLGKDTDDETVLLDRQALHAHRLSFSHPVTEESLEFTAPIPTDLQKLILILQEAQLAE